MTLELRHVSKAYETRHGPAHILKNVNLRVEPGERVGILGQNGSGKSTLIRIVGGSEPPTEGQIVRNMSVSWPLAFGGAFLGTLTGIDNVRFVCRLYGIDPDERLPFIEEFAELGRYLREPFRTYSSGMRARLAFAVSMAIDFDCYLVDEIVAVGDDRFQRKCQAELFDRRKNRALLIVSHSADFVRRHCGRASVLSGGRLTNFSDVDEAYEFYSDKEVSIQAHMAESRTVHLMPGAVPHFASKFAASSSNDEFHSALAQAKIDQVPVADACDVVGRLHRSGHPTAALSTARYLSAKVPLEPLYWVTLGDLLSEDRQHVPAVEAYQEALTLDPDLYWGRRNYATELFNAGRYAEAIPHYERAIAVAPDAAGTLALEMRLLDCRFMLDEDVGHDPSLAKQRFTIVEATCILFSGGGAARLLVGGILGRDVSRDRVKCVFRAGNLEWEGQPVYARNSIRRICAVADTEAFGFASYVDMPAAAGEFEVEIFDGDRSLGTSELAIELVERPEFVVAGATNLENARLANAHHRHHASALYYGLALQSGEPYDIVPFAENLIAIGHFDEAEYRLAEWIDAGNEDPSCIGPVIDLLCAERARSRVPGWRAAVDALLERHSENSAAPTSVLANRGHAAVADGDLVRAAGLYADASAAGGQLIHFARGIHSAEFASEVPFPEKSESAPKKSLADVVHLFACDSNYFLRFASKLVKSSLEARHGRRVVIHAHIVDPDEACLRLAGELSASAEDVQFTWEEAPPFEDYQVRRTYFTCARFLKAPELLRHYGCPVVITETDCLMNWAWPDVLKHIGGSELGYVQSSLWNWVPWTKIPAGFFSFAATPTGIASSDYVASFIRHVFAKAGAGNIDLWTLDQVALWLAHMNAPASAKRVHTPMYSVLTLASGDKLNI